MMSRLGCEGFGLRFRFAIHTRQSSSDRPKKHRHHQVNEQTKSHFNSQPRPVNHTLVLSVGVCGLRCLKNSGEYNNSDLNHIPFSIIKSLITFLKRNKTHPNSTYVNCSRWIHTREWHNDLLVWLDWVTRTLTTTVNNWIERKRKWNSWCSVM